MKNKAAVITAITSAIYAYLQQEEQAKIAAPSPKPPLEINPWRLFGRQELMRDRIRWRHRIRQR